MKYILSTILITISLMVQSQNFLSWKFNDRYFSLSAGTGSATYFGELNYDNKLNKNLSQLNVGIEARLLNRLGARLEATYFTIDGSDRSAPDSTFQRQRNLSFNSRNFQVQLNTIHYLKKYQGDYYRRWIFDPYIMTGVGFLNFTPTADLNDETFLLREAQTEGVDYKKWAVTIPAGIGAKFKINDFTNVNFEIAYNFTFTDYLDDVSKNYATEFSNSVSEFLSNRKDEIGVVNPEIYDAMVAGSQRGDSSNRDGYLLISIKAEFFIPPNLFGSKN
ncbi:MAG: DUF6089 family protein [Ekhidna sp.]